MNREKIMLIVMIVTCTLAWQISAVSAELYTPLLKVSTDNVYLTAGEENQIEITLKNTGDFDVFEVKAVLSVPATTSGISIIDGAHKIFNEIRDGKSKTYNSTLYVDRDVPLGAYTLTLQLDYRKTYRLGSPQLESTTVQIGIVVESVSKPRIWLNVEMEELKLKTGSEEEANIRIENIGDEAVFDVDAAVSSTSPHVVVAEGLRFTQDILETGDNATFKSTLAVSKNAPLGVYTLTMSVSYRDGDGREYLETFTLGFSIDSILVSNQTSVVLRSYGTTPENIKPGDIFDLNLELECLGAIAYDVKTSLSFDFSTGIATLSPTLVSAGDLDPGQREMVSYEMLVGGEVGAGQYPARLTISYLDVDGVPVSLVETVTFSVRGIIDFSLINLDQVEAVEGAATEFEADLLLIGTESVRFVLIEVVEDETFRRTWESEEYLGAVDPDSPIPFDLEFEVAEDAKPGDQTLSLRLEYTDDLNQEHEAIVEVPVSVKEISDETESPKGLIGGLWFWLRRLFGLIP